MTLALALVAVLAGSAYVLLGQWFRRLLGYGDDRDPRWTRKLIDKLPPVKRNQEEWRWHK